MPAVKTKQVAESLADTFYIRIWLVRRDLDCDGVGAEDECSASRDWDRQPHRLPVNVNGDADAGAAIRATAKIAAKIKNFRFIIVLLPMDRDAPL